MMLQKYISIPQVMGMIEESFSGHRLRVRRAEPNPDTIERAIARATKNGHASYVVNGGSVCNSYGYPAETEVVGFLAFVHHGDLWVYVNTDRLPANKVTIAGTARATLPPAFAQLHDGRGTARTSAGHRAYIARRLGTAETAEGVVS